MHQLAVSEAPRLFGIVEEYGEAEDARVAGYGLAYADRAEVDGVEGGFRLSSESAESARVFFEISSRSSGTQRTHVVWPGRRGVRDRRADGGQPSGGESVVSPAFPSPSRAP
ncbi:hypothetical protein ACRAKI_08840 [Saccharothrix isguenensis]